MAWSIVTGVAAQEVPEAGEAATTEAEVLVVDPAETRTPALVGVPRVQCPEGSRSSGDGACIVEEVVCPPGATRDGERCVVGQWVCADGSTPDREGRCVLAATCPDGFLLGDSGICEPDGSWWEERGRPTCSASRGEVDDELVRLEFAIGVAAEAGLTLAGPNDDDDDDDADLSRRLGVPIQVGLGMTHGALSLRGTVDLDVAGQAYRGRRVALELGARCACWSRFYQWRLALVAGYDFGAHGFAVGFVHRSQWKIWNGLVGGVEVGLISTVGALSENGYTVAAGRLGIFVGYVL
ncbi:MAG: hypothetical protein R3B40_13980 [Polyangiales bacterium]